MANKVRERKSYLFWKRITYAFIIPNVFKRQGHGSRLDIATQVCNRMWEEMDERKMFRTQQQSDWEKESLELALNDLAEINRLKKVEKSA
tara:strand:- start:370 stop:639 length:270 start_codon:yes stop_codon:yes gene_type:complete